MFSGKMGKNQSSTIKTVIPKVLNKKVGPNSQNYKLINAIFSYPKENREKRAPAPSGPMNSPSGEHFMKDEYKVIPISGCTGLTFFLFFSFFLKPTVFVTSPHNPFLTIDFYTKFAMF